AEAGGGGARGWRCGGSEGSIGSIRRDARGSARSWTLVPALTCVVALAAPAIASVVRHRRAVRHARPSARPAAARVPDVRARRPAVAGRADPGLGHVPVPPGDTPWRLLATHGVGGAEARSWLAAAEPIYDLRQLRPRHGLTLRFDRRTQDLEALHYEIDDRALLVLERTAEGIHATSTGLPYFTEVRGT